jgi:predicted nucleotidyltransferase
MLELGGKTIDEAALAKSFPGLRLLLLHGSRARGDAGAHSDWDFAYRADTAFDELELRAALVRALGTDDLDLLDLDRAGGLVRYRAARDGKLVIARAPKEYERFALSAVRFWLDAQHAVRAGYEKVLERLGP